MGKKNRVIIISWAIILISVLISFNLLKTNVDSALNSNNDNEQDKMNYPNLKASTKFLGSTEYGQVTVEGPYGNKNSPYKIAYITGVHPLEFASHRAILETVKEKDESLNYCYYIYRIKVTTDGSDYDKGRMNGQLLANGFVVPHIIQQNYDFVVDVHSNQGKGEYSIKRFVFAPLDDKDSTSLALKIMDKIPDLLYYNPESQTSTEYVTIPIIKAGTPTIVYETYLYDPYTITKKHAHDFVNVVDNTKL